MSTDPGPPTAGRARSARARSARWVGLAGAVLLTGAGWLGGALPGPPPPGPVGTPAGWAAVGCWAAGTVLLVGAWWSLREGAPSTGWAYRTAGLWLVPLLFAPPLASRDIYSYACQGWAYAAGHDPYTTGVAAAGCPWLDSVAPIWRDTPAPYGPFFLLLAAAATLGGGLVGVLVGLRVLAVVGVLLAARCLPGLARSAGVPTRRAAWLALASPLVGVHLVAGAHNDAVLVGLLLAGLLVLVRRPGRPVPLLAAGVLLGLAVAVKATALVVLPFAALAAVGGRYTWRALLRDGGRLAAGVLATLVGISLLTGLGLGWVAGLARSGDSEQWTSPPTAIGFVIDYGLEAAGAAAGAVPVTRFVAMLLLAAFLIGLWWRAWRSLRRLDSGGQRGEDRRRGEGGRPGESGRPGEGRQRGKNRRRGEGGRRGAVAARPDADGGRSGAVPQRSSRDRATVPRDVTRARLALLGAGLALAATVVLAPVFHPWYATWPLAVLAVVATRTTWFVLPAAVACFLTLPDGTTLARYTKAPGAVAMTVLVLAGLVWATRRPRVRKGPFLTPSV
ncbi:polyprenol phosphomannose-dependent alpha 1,6 mannosyltransferase MptB [Micromonospora yangpuensis]|uniref:Alpha-1,6-mannosyltransferase n=1 Tax=Micromonospora yangpuensis TaxID=683228 RepID=A0A1C6V193_9ACTN|nr:polyprenol phosphomannose-dependent alpha 1,6 mannosyltransferase MptB [Micromonospora yangpuensis]GGL97480.1 hypothetical protein GCM10012279_13710 [Micromonospora yangpuensis]SCL60043.1 Protein of unknown function [Micromonospora yangpuensis]